VKASFLLVSLLLITACCRQADIGQSELISISITDRNGFTETTSAKERVDRYRMMDFLEPQPYEKVVRVFSRDSLGNTPSCVTTYYPNGQLERLLEVSNGRAMGCYREYFPSGQVAVEARVIGGIGELSSGAERSWLFEGPARSWDEDGNLRASVPYTKGEIDGLCSEFYPNGRLKSSIPYRRGKIEGLAEEYFSDGRVKSQMNYSNGDPHGRARTLWSGDQLASEEEFFEGLLAHGLYWNQAGELEEEVKGGAGFRVVYNEHGCKEVHQYVDGLVLGAIKSYGRRGQLLSCHHSKEGLKHGEEIFYYDSPFQEGSCNRTPRPKLSIHWHDGEIQGVVKSWYPNGQLESQREVGHNKKNGVSTAWYQDGSLMLVEEYVSDELVKGEYYPMGSSLPISRVAKGSGVATIFDEAGALVRRVVYVEGEPDDPV
jgi:antitoxin component YwqK of YwqJK toxin-antitoxin module